jgi:hypothetical protein
MKTVIKTTIYVLRLIILVILIGSCNTIQNRNEELAKILVVNKPDTIIEATGSFFCDGMGYKTIIVSENRKKINYIPLTFSKETEVIDIPNDSLVWVKGIIYEDNNHNTQLRLTDYKVIQKSIIDSEREKLLIKQAAIEAIREGNISSEEELKKTFDIFVSKEIILGNKYYVVTFCAKSPTDLKPGEYFIAQKLQYIFLKTRKGFIFKKSRGLDS